MKKVIISEKNRHMFVEVTEYYLENIDNMGCNNGNYPDYVAKGVDGITYKGLTCRCMGGCSGTDPFYEDERTGKVFLEII